MAIKELTRDSDCRVSHLKPTSTLSEKRFAARPPLTNASEQRALSVKKIKMSILSKFPSGKLVKSVVLQL